MVGPANQKHQDDQPGMEMDTTVDLATICKLCCVISEPESLYRIFETSVILAEGLEPEPIWPIISDLFLVKLDVSDVIQTICIDCINFIQQWKSYIDKCWAAQLTLPEDMRLQKRCKKLQNVDEDKQNSVIFGEVSESGLSVTDDSTEGSSSTKEDSKRPDESQVENGKTVAPSTPDKTEIKETRKRGRPGPLSAKTREEIKKYRENEVKSCEVRLQRYEDVLNSSPKKNVPSPEKKMTSPLKVEPKSSRPLILKSKHTPTKTEVKEQILVSEKPQEVATPVRNLGRKSGRVSFEESEHDEKSVLEDNELLASRSKRTPKPKHIFDPSDNVKKRMSQVSKEQDKKTPPNKRGRGRPKNPVPNMKNEESESGEYTVQINMEDDENDNQPEEKGNETSYVFVATDDGGMELVPSESVENESTDQMGTTIYLNGDSLDYQEEEEDGGEDEDFEEPPKKRPKMKKSVVGLEVKKTPSSKKDAVWIGMEFTEEFITKAVCRPLTENELDIIRSLIKRRRFRELWVLAFIGSVKGSQALKHRECHECHEILECNVKDYDKHVKTLHGVNAIFICEHCGAEIEGSDEYYDHWEDHLQHYACRGCKFYFTTREERDEHKLSDDHLTRQRRSAGKLRGKYIPETTEIGEIATPKLKSKVKTTSLRVPKLDTKQEGMEVECSVCGVEFSSKSDLKVHMTDQHSEKKKKGISIEPAMKKSSVTSAKKLATSVNIDEVIDDLDKEVEISVAFESVEKLSGDEDEGSSVKEHVCPICEESFDNLRRLSTHLVELHDRVRGPLLCEFCDVSFETETEAKKHRTKMHYNQGDFCKLCRKWVGSKKGMEMHMKRHLGEEKTHSCYQCSKSFSKEEYLKAHEEAVHSGQACFECALCSEKFVRRKDCLKHIRDHGDFENYAQFVQEIQVLQEEDEEDGMEDTGIYFAEENGFEDTINL